MKKKSKKVVKRAGKSGKTGKKTAKGGKSRRSVRTRPVRTRSAAGETVLTKPQIVAAAVRFYEKDHKQADIAKTHKISSSYLARILIKSRQKGLFKVRVLAGAVSVAPKSAAKTKRRARRPTKK